MTSLHADTSRAIPHAADPAFAIRALNDSLRRSFLGGRVVVTPGVAALPPQTIVALFSAVRAFDDFDFDNDPHDEHNYGALSIAGERFVWNIDCYDRSLRRHTPDAADPARTKRVLTIMLAQEY